MPSPTRWVGASLLGHAALGAAVDFSVLSMNVAGLPAILNGNEVPGDKTANSELIGSYFTKYGYDMIHVQEVRPPLSQ